MQIRQRVEGVTNGRMTAPGLTEIEFHAKPDLLLARPVSAVPLAVPSSPLPLPAPTPRSSPIRNCRTDGGLALVRTGSVEPSTPRARSKDELGPPAVGSVVLVAMATVVVRPWSSERAVAAGRACEHVAGHGALDTHEHLGAPQDGIRELRLGQGEAACHVVCTDNVMNRGAGFHVFVEVLRRGAGHQIRDGAGPGRSGDWQLQRSSRLPPNGPTARPRGWACHTAPR